MHGWTSDPYFKQRVSFSIKGQSFEFDTAALLFSPHQIDTGSALLLKSVIGTVDAPSRILDLACNYGTIGIVLARFYPQAQVVLADKDLLALRYAAHNAGLNRLTNVETIESIGVRQVTGTFDLIVANIPSKIGDKPIEHDFLLGSYEKLAPGGSFQFVAESHLNRLLPTLSRRHRLKLSEITRQAGSIVYVVKKDQSKRSS